MTPPPDKIGPAVRPATVDRLVWLLIYGGLLLLSLGVFVDRRDDTAGNTMQAVGAGAAALGVLLVWLRSRMKDTAEETPK